MTKSARKPVIAAKRGRGRPPSEEGAAVAISGRVRQETVEAMDAWAVENGLTRSEAMGLLIEAALKRPPRIKAKG